MCRAEAIMATLRQKHRFEVAEARLFQQCAEHGAVACLRPRTRSWSWHRSVRASTWSGIARFYQRTASWPELSSRG